MAAGLIIAKGGDGRLADPFGDGCGDDPEFSLHRGQRRLDIQHQPELLRRRQVCGHVYVAQQLAEKG